ncbi:MAG: methionine ABC transporter permease [Cardiobacteriaceae bacterium]|nr:methionine ABC transporter permease [Cardiobacteriaceae bacterium]
MLTKLLAWLHASISDTAYLLLVSTFETLYMTLSATFFATLLGVPLGVILYATRRGRFLSNPGIYYPLGIIVNVGRSIPYLILALWIIPLTRVLVGVSIGNTAAIVPLTLAATPFIARMVENMSNEVPSGLIEAAQAMGASPLQIINKVLLPEALPGLVNALTITLIALIGYSAIAGSLGAGGLGKVAYAYGYQRYRPDIMLYTVCIIVILVQLIQWSGDALARRFDHR